MPFSPNVRAARALAAALLLALPPLAQTDILHLRDGNRHYGTLEQQTETEVIFRVRLKPGGATMLRRFPRGDVLRVERTDIDAPPETGNADADADVTRADTGRLTERDAEQILREAFELLDDADHAAALRAMQRLVSGSDRESRATLSALARESRGIPLDQLLARTRLHVAMHGPHQRIFHLQYVSPYEADAMAALLENLQTENTGALFHGRSIESWATDSASYATLMPDALDMVRKTRLATAAVSARLRFDPRVKRDAAARGKLIVLRDQLTTFAAHVRALTGFTQLRAIDDESDPTLIEARRIAASQPATQPTTQTTTQTSRPTEELP